MSQQVRYQGRTYTFPDDAADDEIAEALEQEAAPAPPQASRPGSVIGAGVGTPLSADENERAQARQRATEQEGAAEGLRRLATPLGGGLSRVLTDPFTDPDNRRRMGANLAAAWRGIDSATRRDPYDEIPEEEMEANRRRFLRQAPPQISAAVRHQLTPEGEAERARAITEAASTVGRGVAHQFTREGEADRARVVRATPRVAGEIGRAITYGPFVDQPRAQQELRIGRRMQDAGFATQEEVDALADESLRQSGGAAINLAFAPFDAALLAKGGAQALRGLPRLAGPSARSARPPSARPPRPRRISPRQAAAEQRALDEALVRDLESEFGTLTAGERARNLRDMQREESLRRAGPEETRAALRDFNDMRAQQLSENAIRRLATRDLPPQNPDYASTGNTLADSLRTQRDAKLAERSQFYERAMALGAGDAIAPTDELIDTVLATSREHFGNLDSEAIAIVRQLQDEIASGQATYARVERARQALNAELAGAMRDPRGGRQVMAIHSIIDDLDAFAAPRVRPETRKAILEARRVTRELGDMYGEQLRPTLATGQTGRRDLGGATVRRILESDVVGERVMDTIFGAGARPSQATFAAVRRIVQNAKRQIASGGYEAPTGAATGRTQRTSGAETLRPGRGTKGGRTFDPSPTQQERFGTELPREDYQALREAFVYRLIRPLEARGSGDAIPFGALATNLRQALDGPGKEITELLLNPSEVAQARRLLRLMEQGAQPAGSYAPSAPGIAQDAIERSIGGLISRLVGGVPGLEGAGEAIRRGVRDARAIRDARTAIANPTIPRPPRLLAPAPRPALATTTKLAPPPTPRPPPLRGPSRGKGGRALSGLLTGGAIGAGALLAAPGEAQAQEASPELVEARAEVDRMKAGQRLLRRASETHAEADVLAAQQFLQGEGFYDYDTDGDWGDITRDAIRDFNNGPHFAEAQRRVTELELLAQKANPAVATARVAAPWAVGLAALAGGHRLRGAGVRAAERRLAQRDARAGAMVNTGPILRGNTADSRAEPIRRMGRMNDYWSEGLPQSPASRNRVPFRRAEGGGFEPNPNAAAGSELFPPQNAFLRAPDYAVFGGGTAEAAFTTAMWHRAEEKEAAAEAAFAVERTGANLALLEQARNEVAMWETANRLGLGLMLGRAGGLGHRYPTARPPSVGAAESEVALLNSYLARPPRPPRAPRPPPTPPAPAPRKRQRRN